MKASSRAPRMVLSATLVALALAGCGRDYAQQAVDDPDAPAVVISPGQPSDLHGVELDRPLSKAGGVFVDTGGKAFDFAAETSGRLTLVYAGYTNCPDVCPTTVADIAAALRGLPAADRREIDVVMFSTDPDRDTPERMRLWLDQFDPTFQGATGEPDELIAAINSMGIDVQPPVAEADGTVLVEHGAQVLAFAPDDDAAHVLWTSGTSATEYREDLQVLLERYRNG